MFTLKRHIRIGAEAWIEDPEDSQVDVVVTFPDSTKWISNFYTIKCIESIREDYRVKGHCLNGAYWCGSSPVIIVDRVSRERIEQVVDELMGNQTFQYLFEYLGAVDERDLTVNSYPEGFFEEDAKIDPSYVAVYAARLDQMLDQSSPELRAKILRLLSESV
ncbi:hypothetical protein [Paenibacillus sp. DYY-L-2]|uniref:hypothetical protein n=1 Tax=Paenibacillus sp. DYY-L-2 TaxID=3447013 RepID=UPI003F507D1D